MSCPKIVSSTVRRCRLILKKQKRVLWFVSVSTVLLAARLAQQAGLSRLVAAASVKKAGSQGQDGQNSPDGLWERMDQAQSLQRQSQAQIRPDSFRAFR